jgi:hypothetical protein
VPSRAREREEAVRLAGREIVITESASAIARLIEVVREILDMRRGLSAGV